MGSSRSPGVTWRDASCARTAGTIDVSVYILPRLSWSPKRLSGMSTLIACTEKTLVGAPPGHGVPGPEPAIARSVPTCAKRTTGASSMTATPPCSARRSAPRPGTRHASTCGASHGRRRANAAATAPARIRLTGNAMSASRDICVANDIPCPPCSAENSTACSGPKTDVVIALNPPTTIAKSEAPTATDGSTAERDRTRRVNNTPAHTASITTGNARVASRSQWTTNPGCPASTPPST